MDPGAPAGPLLNADARNRQRTRHTLAEICRVVALPMSARHSLRVLYWFLTGTFFKRKRMRDTAAEIIAAGLFDPSFYIKRYPDIQGKHVDPAAHYIEHGAYENRRANG